MRGSGRSLEEASQITSQVISRDMKPRSHPRGLGWGLDDDVDTWGDTEIRDSDDVTSSDQLSQSLDVAYLQVF